MTEPFDPSDYEYRPNRTRRQQAESARIEQQHAEDHAYWQQRTIAGDHITRWHWGKWRCIQGDHTADGDRFVPCPNATHRTSGGFCTCGAHTPVPHTSWERFTDEWGQPALRLVDHPEPCPYDRQQGAA